MVLVPERNISFPDCAFLFLFLYVQSVLIFDAMLVFLWSSDLLFTVKNPTHHMPFRVNDVSIVLNPLSALTIKYTKPNLTVKR